MPRKAFRTVVGHMLWKEEYRRRFQLCVASARLARIADELTRLAEEESGEGLRRRGGRVRHICSSSTAIFTFI